MGIKFENSRACSRLYRHQILILQVNTRWKALDEIYKINTLLHRSKHKITKMLREIVCKKLTFFHALQIFARALPESVIFRRDFHGILPEPELRQIQHYCQRSVYYPEIFSNNVILKLCQIKPQNLQIFGSLNFRGIAKFQSNFILLSH